MASTEGFAAVFYSEPSVLGLLSNVISAFLVCLQNFSFAHTNIRAEGVENILAGVHLILIGGLSQLLAGFLAFRKYDHLGGTAFLAFAALWSSYGATRVISGAYPPLNTTLASENATYLLPTDAAQPSTSESAVAGLVAYIFISFILSFCSATVNYIMPFVFGAITLTLVFEAVGLFGQWALVVSGVLELVIVVCGLYGAVALLFKGITQRYVLPGFGNPLFNVLLLGSGNSGSSKTIGEEKKKNTKYAEPMALNHLCDTISPFIFAFYAFGYMKTFYIGAIWVSIISICQLFSSFYGYLRDDVYYTTKFGVHSLYWLVMSWEEFTLTVFISIDDVQQSRMGMIGDWFFLATACMLFLMAFNKDVLEVLQNAAFVLLTISTIHQIPIRGAYVFFGVSCSLYTAISLYATFASLINSIGEKALIPIGAQVMSSSVLESVLMSVKSYLMRSKNIPGTTICEVSDALFYICNGLAALSAIQASYSNLVLLCLTFVMEVLIICFLLFTVEHLPVPLEIVMLSIFGAICIYGATASLANCIFGKDLIMMGPPLFRVEMTKEDTKDPPPCFCPSSHRTSSLRSIANLLNEGAVCGVPTDTVYALAASCKQPEAIEKIYRIKDRPQEKPICIFISNLDQLRAAAPPFSPLLWDFMENVYPGGIGCIIKKGEWLKKRLGHKLEGVLCDGESNEVVASTVVNCTKIDEGGITILREGCVPAAKVRQIFERVKNGAA
ncbi:Putative tRNA threonylcarbamoyladenosine biosynthesis protein YwlC [Chelonia mydas]|uniref:Threonylcarbamoyl-AMP synthase n=1 Tax=Chelonia mydas TaxID=8469 RepID=M7B8Y9_CHEMY|nr:Putative tRNA threonylcarbamoyladenosine biosynthesis protein YwlC [Chelonia mydas]